MPVTTDSGHMASALGLAARGLGLVAPNPAVGCILVKNNKVVGRGWTQPGGRPHAETEALARAGIFARGATAYVTLEPCSHHGATPPCADALIAAGISWAVIALEDPDPRVSGRGIARLREAGIEVSLGLGADKAAELNAGFFLRIEKGRPLITLKLATTLDGRIATRRGESQWITGEGSRRRSHLLRRRHDAVMVGSGTILSDNPLLNVRLDGIDVPPPVRIIVDGRLRTPLTSKLVAEAAHGLGRVILITLPGGDARRLQAFEECKVEVVEVPAGQDGAIDLTETLQLLGRLGLTRILVEGGATLAASLLQADLVDRIAWFRSASIIGGDGIAAIKAFGVDRLADQVRFQPLTIQRVEDDVLETFRHGG